MTHPMTRGDVEKISKEGTVADKRRLIKKHPYCFVYLYNRNPVSQCDITSYAGRGRYLHLDWAYSVFLYILLLINRCYQVMIH